MVVHAQQAVRLAGHRLLDGINTQVVGLQLQKEQAFINFAMAVLVRLAEALEAGLVDGVQHRAAQQGDAVQALHQQQVGQLTAAADLVMVDIEHRGVDRAADGDKGQLALLQQRDQGVTLQRAGQDDAVDLVVDQQALHGLGLLLAHHGQQHIVIVAGHHIADGGDGFAQKRTLKVRKLARKHQRNIIGLFGDETFRHHVGNIVFFSGIVYHALAGCFTYAAIAGQSTGYRCFRYSQILRHTGDVHNAFL